MASKNILEGRKPTGLVLDGTIIPCRAKVFNWRDTGLETKIAGNNKRRLKTQIVDLFIVHWSGGYGDAAALHRVLNSRELGSEFYIDYDGSIVEFCDPVLVNTADAGPVNKRSFGAEVRCGGFPVVGRERPDQPIYDGVLRGRARDYVDFSSAQKEALLALLEALRDAKHPRVQIPLVVPGGAARTLTTGEMAAFKGVAGHYHVSTNKADPGPKVMADLGDAFRARAA